MSHIGLRQLRSFVYAAELGSLSLAAERLNIAQPAISRHIQLLEGSLGTKLFHRDGRGMKVTARGRLLLARAAEVLREVGRIEAEFGGRDAAGREELSFAMPASVDDAVVAGLLDRVSTDLPQARIRLMSMQSDAVVMALTSGQLDLGVLAAPLRPVSGLRTGPPVEERFHLVGTDLPAAGGTIRLREALAVPLVLPGEACELRRILGGAAAGQGLELSVAAEIDRLAVLVDLVARGKVATILPLHPFRRLLGAGIVQSAEIVDPGVYRSLVIASAAGRQTDGMIECLSGFLAASLVAGDMPAPPGIGRER